MKYRVVSAREWTPDKWPVPTPEQAEFLRHVLPPIAAAQPVERKAA